MDQFDHFQVNIKILRTRRTSRPIYFNKGRNEHFKILSETLDVATGSFHLWQMTDRVHVLVQLLT